MCEDKRLKWADGPRHFELFHLYDRSIPYRWRMFHADATWSLVGYGMSGAGFYGHRGRYKHRATEGFCIFGSEYYDQVCDGHLWRHLSNQRIMTHSTGAQFLSSPCSSGNLCHQSRPQKAQMHILAGVSCASHIRDPAETRVCVKGLDGSKNSSLLSLGLAGLHC